MTKLILTIVGCAAAGFVGAMAAVQISDDSGRPAPAAVNAGGEMRAQIEDLRAEVRAIKNQVEILRKAPPMASAPMGGAGLLPSSTAMEEPVADAAEIMPVPGGQFEEKVREMVKESERARWENMGKRFAAMAKQRESGLLDRMSENHGLAAYQRDRLTAVLDRRREAVGEFFRTLFGGDTAPEDFDMGKIRAKIEEVQRETNEEIQTILTPEQFEVFQAEDPGRRGPWGGGRGR